MMNTIPEITRSRSSNRHCDASAFDAVQATQSTLGCIQHDALDAFQLELIRSLHGASDYCTHSFFQQHASILYKFVIGLYVASLNGSNSARSTPQKEQSLCAMFHNELSMPPKSSAVSALPRKPKPPPVPADAIGKNKTTKSSKGHKTEPILSAQQKHTAPPVFSLASGASGIEAKPVDVLQFKRGLDRHGKLYRDTTVRTDNGHGLLPQRSILDQTVAPPKVLKSRGVQPKTAAAHNRQDVCEMEGILKLAPTANRIGSILCKSGLITVPYQLNYPQIESQQIFAGMPIFFECVIGAYAQNIRKQPAQKTAFDCQGVLEVMPTSLESPGWIYSNTGMIKVPFEENMRQITAKAIAVGSPVVFCCMDLKTATNLRQQHTVRQTIVRNCLETNNGKTRRTKHDAKHYVVGTQLKFSGDLKQNVFQVPTNCVYENVGKIAEKTLNAFVNTEGGVLYFGVDASYKIVGVKTKGFDMTLLERCIKMAVSNFTPNERVNLMDKVQIKAISLVNGQGKVIDELMVLKISIPGPFNDANGNQIIFSTQSGDKFKKTLSYIAKII